MIQNINLTNDEINQLHPLKTLQTRESTVYPFLENKKLKLIKVFNKETNFENKIEKIVLLKERLNGIKEVVTADKLVFFNGQFKGYSMDYIKGNLFIPSKKYTLEEMLSILKQISITLKKIHKNSVVCADFQRNIIIHNYKPYFIDHDNFAIDNLGVDLKNIYLQKYEESIKIFDERFDYYLLNLLTLASINFMETRSVYDKFKTNPELFYFEDDEITDIVIKTMYLDDSYNENLIIDKIKNYKDIKKIKRKY